MIRNAKPLWQGEECLQSFVVGSLFGTAECVNKDVRACTIQYRKQNRLSKIHLPGQGIQLRTGLSIKLSNVTYNCINWAWGHLSRNHIQSCLRARRGFISHVIHEFYSVLNVKSFQFVNICLNDDCVNIFISLTTNVFFVLFLNSFFPLQYSASKAS